MFVNHTASIFNLGMGVCNKMPQIRILNEWKINGIKLVGIGADLDILG